MPKRRADDILSSEEAAAYLGVKTATLLKWSEAGKGPRSCKYGEGRTARRMYRRGWLDEYIALCVDVAGPAAEPTDKAA